MFCTRCGRPNPDEARFCGGCGTGIAGEVRAEPVREMGFGRSIGTCLAKYFDFGGRATRSEYWWFYLFFFLVGIVAAVVDQSGIAYLVVNLGLGLPSVSAATRRLHDTGRSGWWQLIALTIVGIVPLLVWLASMGEDRPNRYGMPARA